MKGLYRNAGKVYFVFTILSLIGIYCALHLKISLFPNSQQPRIQIQADYVGKSPDEFKALYGQRIEEAVTTIKAPKLSVQSIKTAYYPDSMRIVAFFNWGGSPDQALRETKAAVDSIVASLPQEMIRGISVTPIGSDVFFGVTFTSDQQSVQDLYSNLNRVIVADLQSVPSVQTVELLHPDPKDISIRLNPLTLASLHVSAQGLADSIQANLYGLSGGSVETNGRKVNILAPAAIANVEDLRNLPITLPEGRVFPLKNLADVEFKTSEENAQRVKLNGHTSLLLAVKPKPGSNLKEMSETVIERLNASMQGMPKDIHYKVIMDPSEYVNRSVKNLAWEVLAGSLLASLFLFLFIGSLRNVGTAAIEIPMSMLLAFALMKVFDINITLFSLSGLALAAGMNVDASVVVMENIFRRIELMKGPRTPALLLQTVSAAAREVAAPVIFSTIASLVVFVPFLMLDGFSYALLGDLAKVVIFSHGFSALIALILVPTVRYHMLLNDSKAEKEAPLHALLVLVENAYGKLLRTLLQNPARAWTFLLISVSVGGLILAFILPRLPKEVIARPESDWVALTLEGDGTQSIRSIESAAGRFERKMKEVAGDHFNFTFTWIYSKNGAYVMGRLKDKKEVDSIKELLKEKLTSEPDIAIDVGTWNMSEFSIPTPADQLYVVTGGTPEERVAASRDIRRLLEGMKVWSKVSTQPSTNINKSIRIEPSYDRLNILQAHGMQQSIPQIMEDVRILTRGKWVGNLMLDQIEVPIFIKSEAGVLKDTTDINGLPILVGKNVLPFSSLFDVKKEDGHASILRENGRELMRIELRIQGKHQEQLQNHLKQAEQIIEQYRRDRVQKKLPALVIQSADSDPDFHDSVRQLYVAFGFSILLIFVVLQIQFQKFTDSLVVMVAVPLGLLGSSIALYAFGSNISLNSILGMTLLNGIAVNNSILLVDAIRAKFNERGRMIEDVVEASQQRIRPILITSLTTIVGMLPIALGLGEGGRVLQPLGISVAGGLGCSMILTLLFVPLLQGSSMRRTMQVSHHGIKDAVPTGV